MDIESEIKKYLEKLSNRSNLYRTIAQNFNIKNAIYPGSHIDILPSYFIENVVYIDSFKGSKKIFSKMDKIMDNINQNKIYENNSIVKYLFYDYMQKLPLEENYYDLIISQYAGFVGQYTKKYLKKGGILLCNDSHGDATLSYLDSDFELVGVISNEGIFSNKNLLDYFKLKNNQKIDKYLVLSKMKGLKYQNFSDNYVFRKK